MSMVKLTVDGIPAQVINFAKAYRYLFRLDEEEFWRREIAGVVDGLLQILPDDSADPDHIRKCWILDEATEQLRKPRSEEMKKIDRECLRLHEQEKKRRR